MRNLQPRKIMSTLKTKIEQGEVLSFLEKHLGTEIRDLTFIEGGEDSQAFSFSSGGQDLIFRAGRRKGGFEKDRYAYEHFASATLPIPRIIEIGPLDEKRRFAISEKATGKTLDKFTEKEREAFMPILLEVLDAIHAIDVRSTKGYGHWDDAGNARYRSWQSHLQSMKKWVGGRGGQSSLFETTVLEKEVWQRVYDEILKLITYCPEERCLVHGDYGFNNAFSDGKEITAVIDWAESCYGDFLYDGAWLSYWSTGHRYRAVVKEHYARQRRDVPYFDERMRCYELHIGLGVQSFFANSHQETKYERNKERLLALL